MRKTITTMGLGLALTLGAAMAGAQATQATKPDSARREHRGGGWQKGERGGRGGRGMGMLLKDINLTDAQKAQLKQKREANEPQEKAFHEQMKSAFDAMKAAREKNDQGAIDAAKTRMDQLRKEGTERRDRQVAELRSILTSEQRTQLEKNLADAKARMEQRRADGHEGRKGRDQSGR